MGPDDGQEREQIEIRIDLLLMDILGDPEDLAFQYWGGISLGDGLASALNFRSADCPDADQRILRDMGMGMDEHPSADLKPQRALSTKYGDAVTGVSVLNVIFERDPTSTEDITGADLRRRSGLLAELILRPYMRFIEALEPLSKLDPEADIGFVFKARYGEEVKKLQELYREVGPVLEQAHRDLTAAGAKWDADKQRALLASPSPTGGRGPNAVTKLIGDVWEFLTSNAKSAGRPGFHGNLNPVHQDIKNFLEPFVEVSTEVIRQAIGNLQRQR